MLPGLTRLGSGPALPPNDPIPPGDRNPSCLGSVRPLRRAPTIRVSTATCEEAARRAQAVRAKSTKAPSPPAGPLRRRTFATALADYEDLLTLQIQSRGAYAGLLYSTDTTRPPARGALLQKTTGVRQLHRHPPGILRPRDRAHPPADVRAHKGLAGTGPLPALPRPRAAYGRPQSRRSRGEDPRRDRQLAGKGFRPPRHRGQLPDPVHH